MVHGQCWESHQNWNKCTQRAGRYNPYRQRSCTHLDPSGSSNGRHQHRADTVVQETRYLQCPSTGILWYLIQTASTHPWIWVRQVCKSLLRMCEKRYLAAPILHESTAGQRAKSSVMCKAARPLSSHKQIKPLLASQRHCLSLGAQCSRASRQPTTTALSKCATLQMVSYSNSKAISGYSA